MTMKAKKLIFIKCCWGCSTDSKFTISETLAHMVAPWLRTGGWKLGLLTVLLIERVKVARLHDSELLPRSFAPSLHHFILCI